MWKEAINFTPASSAAESCDSDSAAEIVAALSQLDEGQATTPRPFFFF